MEVNWCVCIVKLNVSIMLLNSFLFNLEAFVTEREILRKTFITPLTTLCQSRSSIRSLEANAHSFKRFTSQLLKLSFSLFMHVYTSDERHA